MMAPHFHPPRANRPAGTGLRTLAGLFLFLCLFPWSGLSTTPALRADAPDALRFRVQQITSGPNHHWFGYIGQSLTIPWSEDGRFILALEAAFHDRMPGSEDAARVVLIDTRQDHRMLPVDETRAWNFQQGTMFYWRPGAAGNQFFFNDRDPSNGAVFTVLYDATRKRRVREYRFAETPIGNSGVSPAGDAFLAINYGRLARLRSVTGYPGTWDWSKEEAAPANDGIFVVDILSGQKRLLVSYQQLAQHLERHVAGSRETALFINHTLWNREGERIYFFVRGGWAGNPGTKINVPCSVRADGTGLVLHDQHIGGHPEWGEGARVIGCEGPHQVYYDVDARRVVGRIGTPELFPNPEGDIAMSPDGKWFVNGWSSGNTNRYAVLNLTDGRFGWTPPLDRGDYRGDLRIDSAPRWNRTSDALLVPGIAGDGTRQLFRIDW